ncbi:bifunctional N-acetylglucosamine-1-phosphate uridyltransferase/glucosamine-1-phosphate acetyltransferase [Denitrobacterium detoxificans]|uniref:Bifunctional protein GlmU n=1 Tax=Denitrobacterium detoxificans TaxID=79604 RepID=A0A172RWS9_9ACTN|nr:bifunctional UDP-N-acetylglucosamine diphosphorylase/glucosamine-1-phosphate N-acetyltransferase GlmU [Denitrobacterium detoxificans]ANE22167.1 bifunctional N-acetylglucosamine-1-phosphate uridyltransferase/glucosamine-1-phosphate acetyltransferase [Denitrobacterium detoxificans]SEO83690.1 bifunctional UDP-N-acetylglucosamine pyrophosphorylase / Glucosamine-1-phosphate N-acetyltransferase [Denitrobacterium detoxificans]
MEASAIILAAGEGTRMKSRHPKVSHKLLGRPLVRWVVEAAHDAGIGRIVTVLGHAREVVESIVADTNIVIQQEQRGTADAVMACASEFQGVTGSLLVLSGDSPLITPETLSALVAAREQDDAGVVVLTMQPADPTGYGRIVRDAAGQVERIVEQKDCTPEEALIGECNSGFYCFDAQLLFQALSKVGTNNAQGEFYLTDVIEIARNEGRSVLGFCAADSNECLGINTRVQLAQASQVMQRRINERHMLAGVTMTDPSTVWIGPDVKLAQDVEILPMTTLLGAVEVGPDTVLGPNTRLTDTTVGAGCVIDETVAVETVIDDGCTCGPRAYLRPGTHLCEGAKAGTHVEIKKSTIGPGSKVPHLSYIGDTTMAGGVNIGAGSITCNYDGERKWPTVIGENAFVGSDTMMVAPVTIGSHALVGAGSVITEDVPDCALALGRARQVVKEQYRAPKQEQ